jgi:AraC family transcriptional regulator
LEYRFKAAISSTPLKELMRMRIRRARELLASTALPVATVAKQCGFSRANYFAEAFTRENRVSPAEYRAQVR